MALNIKYITIKTTHKLYSLRHLIGGGKQLANKLDHRFRLEEDEQKISTFHA